MEATQRFKACDAPWVSALLRRGGDSGGRTTYRALSGEGIHRLFPLTGMPESCGQAPMWQM